MTHVGLSPVIITKGFLFERSAELGVSGDTEKMFSSTDVHIYPRTHTYLCWRETFFHISPMEVSESNLSRVH